MLLALLLATLAPARAEIPVSMTVGGFGLVDTAGGGWIGEYVYFGPVALFPLTESGSVSFLPQLTLEVAPEDRRGSQTPPLVIGGVTLAPT